jgi:hypothetical protein
LGALAPWKSPKVSDRSYETAPHELVAAPHHYESHLALRRNVTTVLEHGINGRSRIGDLVQGHRASDSVNAFD